jgi:hypothetical protein
MLNKKFVKFALIIPALASLFLMASVPNFSTKTNGENVWLATEGEITLNKTIHDFGIVKQNGGNVSATFIITNNTKAPVVLHVTASCGCTTPQWTKEPIEPGKTGEVVATYNPLGRPGPFDKSITITTTTGKAETLKARIKGTVE